LQHIFELFDVENIATLKSGSTVIQDHCGTTRKPTYYFLLVFHINYGPN